MLPCSALSALSALNAVGLFSTRASRGQPSGLPGQHRAQLRQPRRAFRPVGRRRLLGGELEVVAQFGNEARRLAFAPFLALLAPLAIRQMQAAPRARDADVHEAPLLLDAAGVDRFTVRQDAFLDADH